MPGSRIVRLNDERGCAPALAEPVAPAQVVRCHLVRGEEPIAAGAALSAQTGPALGFAGLLVELADPHFFLDPASLDQFAEAADGLLGRLLVS